MKTENKILKFLIELKKPLTIREISKRIGSDYRITHTAVQRLLDKKILLAEKVGKSSLCTLNTSYYGPEIYAAENERREAVLKNRNMQQLYNEVLAKIGTSQFIFILFGSYVGGKQTKSSDIDMMFISNEKDFEKKIADILSLLPLKTHCLVFTEEEFARMKNSHSPNVVKEVMKKNIILYGTEQYYLIANA